MKKIFTCLGLFAIIFGVNAQGIEIYLPDDDVDVSGTIISLDAGGELMYQDFDVKNVSGVEDILWIERVKILELEGTGDYLCWGTDLASGACYSEGAVTPFDPWVTTDAAALENDSAGWLSVHHVAHGVVGCAQYRYYVINSANTRLDSVDVLFCSTVSIEEDIKVTVLVYPNPAADFVNVTMENANNNVNFTLYNILSEVMVTANLTTGTNKVAVDELPNGVYFYSILKDGDILETKKLVVRH